MSDNTFNSVDIWKYTHTNTHISAYLFTFLNVSVIKICKTEADRAVVERTFHQGVSRLRVSVLTATNFILPNLRNHCC